MSITVAAVTKKWMPKRSGTRNHAIMHHASCIMCHVERSSDGQCELRPGPGGPARPQSPHRRSGNSPCHSAIDHDLACEAGSTQVLVLHPSMSSVRCLQGWCTALHANIKSCFHMQAGRPQPLATVFSLDPCPLYVIGCWIVRASFHSLLIC